MSNWVLVFLGVIALASFVQTAFLIALALQGRRLSRRLDGLSERFERELRPTLESLARVSRNVAEISDLGVLQARRIDDVLADTLEKIEDTTGVIRRMVLRPLGPLLDIAAFFKGVRRGLDVYHRLRGFERHSRGSVRAEAEDEHLFI
jgi:hypothetical protein